MERKPLFVHAEPRRANLGNAGLLAMVAVIVLAFGPDLRVVGASVHVPIAIGLLLVAGFLAAHDRIRSVWVAHHLRRAPAPSRVPAHGTRPSPRPTRDPRRASRPGWL